MAEKMTPWFEADTKPARDGQYEVSRLVYSFKNSSFVRGRHRLDFREGNWHYPWTTTFSIPGSLAAMSAGILPAMIPGEARWRGLASDPKKANHD